MPRATWSSELDCSQGMQGRFGSKDYTELGGAGRPHRHVRRRQGAERSWRRASSKWLTEDGSDSGRRRRLNRYQSHPEAARPCEPTGDNRWPTRTDHEPHGASPDQEGDRQRLDRLGARVLRLLHLRDRGVADLSADLLPEERSRGRPSSPRSRPTASATSRARSAPSFLGHWGDTHGRKTRADHLHVPDGLLDDGRRPACRPTTRSACWRRRCWSCCA